MSRSSSSSWFSVGYRGSLLGWKRDEWRKQAARVSLLPPETDEEEDDDETITGRRGRFLIFLVIVVVLGLPVKKAIEHEGRRRGR